MNNNEISLFDRFFEHNPDTVDILNRVTDAMTLTECMFDFYEYVNKPLPITEDDLSTIRQANQILIDLYYTMKGDTE